MEQNNISAMTTAAAGAKKEEKTGSSVHPTVGRIVLLVFLLGLFAFAAYSQRDEVRKVYTTVCTGNRELLIVAMLIQIGYWFTFALMYKTSYAVVGVKGRVRELLPVWLASLFVNVAAPAAAPAVFLDDAARRGQSPAKAAAGMLVLRLTDFGTLIVFVSAGLAFMATRDAMRPIHLAALAGLIGVTLVWGGPLFLARWWPKALFLALKWVQDVTNRLFRWIRRPEPLGADWASLQSLNFSESAGLVFAEPRRLIAPAAVATLAHLLDMLSLHVLLLAFGIGPDLGVSLAAFAVCLLYWIVSPVPDGIGFVETAVAFALVHMNAADKPQAIAAALAFRGITLYLPVLIGAFCLPRLALVKDKEPEK